MNLRRTIKGHMSLSVYDMLVYIMISLFMFVFTIHKEGLNWQGIVIHVSVAFVLIFGFRLFGKIYRQIWRYGGIECYIKLLIADVSAYIIYGVFNVFFAGREQISWEKLIAFCCVNTLASLTMRMVYRYAYKSGSRDDIVGKGLRFLLNLFAFGRVMTEADPDSQKIRVAIIGAGSVGVNLMEEIKNNPTSNYVVRCFVDKDLEKVGRELHGMSVVSEDEASLKHLKKHHVQVVIFAIPNMDAQKKIELYDYYQKAGFGVKIYDYPTLDVPGKKRTLRKFKIEDFLMRKPEQFLNEKTYAYYKGKTVLITGGGGSIGSELCRQLAKMEPKQLIILDIYENGVYDLQQDLKIIYGNKLDVKVEIVSITNKRGMARVFEKYHPEIVINAAAHKHVPFMETNCIEAVENNIFGTLNVVQLCEEFGTERFMMVSTDKAVNPTNVMGATKRMCERIMQAYSTRGKVKCSATRFGNVLGSAGSVIPLFKKQIDQGGPVTVTDKRIIRYFMTIPEASQLVLTSGEIAHNGELFILDMGKPVKIWDLARNMVEMSGRTDVEIVEIGLRPGEKLYEELLVKKEEVEKTENNLIFIERDKPITMEKLEEKLELLREACNTDNNDNVREVLHKVVSTFKRPEEVNGN